MNLARIFLLATALVLASYQSYASDVLEELIVTARKQSENLQDVPTTAAVMSEQTLDELRIQKVQDLSILVPGLIASETTGLSGGGIAMRGFTSAHSSPIIDQAVSINIDGVPVNDARLMHAALLDIQQVEVLKGPQVLFWGKNSPGGVMAFHSADPTDEFQLEVGASYGTEGKEKSTDVILSGAFSETVSGRLAMSYSEADGLYDVIGVDAPVDFNGTTIAAPLVDSDSFSDEERTFVRGTLRFEPNDNFTATLKYTYSDVESVGGLNRIGQRIFCPSGSAQALVANHDCKKDNKLFSGTLQADTIGANVFGDPGHPDGILETETHLAALHLSYHLPDQGLTIESITGYYDSEQYNQSDASFGPATILGIGLEITAESVTQELRISSDWESAVNFSAGLFFDDRTNGNLDAAVIRLPFLIFPGSPVPGGIFPTATDVFEQDAESWSAFVQLDWDISDQLNLSGGVRYSDEEKEFDRIFGGVEVLQIANNESWSNLSPEATLTYHLNDDIMMFLSYREGFKSGGFDGSPDFTGLNPANPANDFRYDEEEIRGFEIGMKSELLNRTLRLNAAIFSYDIDAMQQGVFNPVSLGLKIFNAGDSKTEGFEVEMQWITPVEGLELTASLNYLDAQFNDFIGDCYTGQTIAQGCNQTLINGAFLQQDLSGTTLQVSPEWTGGIGVNFERPVGDWNLSVAGYAAYSDSYLTAIDHLPDSDQESFWVTNLSASLSSPDGRWEFYIKGRNLGDEYWNNRSFTIPLTGNGRGTATAVRGDVGGIISGGREVWLGVTFRHR